MINTYIQQLINPIKWLKVSIDFLNQFIIENILTIFNEILKN